MASLRLGVELSSSLHQALSDYATLAESLKERLVEVDEDFDAALITEAKELARALAAAPAAPPPADSEVKDATRLRNGLLRLLQDKMALVRKAAARVFQRTPEVLREVTSSYERRRRAAARRAKAARDAAKPEIAPAKGPAESPLLG
ncbi:hypothetical protein [Sorangium cellulosum]|uniref:hypothetical protein n=1 Tax=Sorangium cellulosum TaxID=56 RepID=UPI003D9C3C70